MNYLLIGGLALVLGAYLYHTADPLVPGEPSFTLYWWKKCGHCTKFMPEFIKLGHSVKGIKIRQVEASLNNEHKVDSFPTMVYRDADGNEEEYQGERSAAAISNFLRSK